MKCIKLAPSPSHQSEEYIRWSIERALEFLASTTMGNERKKHRKEKKKPKKQRP
jgi:hypothetical protein